MNRTMLGGLLALVAVITLGMQTGCGAGGPKVDTQPVSGTVTLNGSPVENAIVTFVPDSGNNAAAGRTDASGKYVLNTLGIAGAPTGSYKVKILKMQMNTSGAPPVVMGQDEELDASYDPTKEAEAKPPADFKPLPAKYANEKTSGFTATVTEGENTADFAMTD